MTPTDKRDAVYRHQFDESYGDNWTLGIVTEAILHGRQRAGRDASHITRLLREKVAQAISEAERRGAERVVEAVASINPYSRSDVPLEVTGLEVDGKGCWILGWNRSKNECIKAAQSALDSIARTNPTDDEPPAKAE